MGSREGKLRMREKGERERWVASKSCIESYLAHVHTGTGTATEKVRKKKKKEKKDYACEGCALLSPTGELVMVLLDNWVLGLAHTTYSDPHMDPCEKGD